METIAAFARRQGLPPAVAEGWARRGLRTFTGVQAEALRRGMIEDRRNWLIAAPTSAGKGILAEIVTARHLAAGERVVWLAPTRALAEQVAARLAEAFAPAGWRVICATGERAENDGALARGRFECCVAVYEKALGWLGAEPDALAGVGLVVADDLALLRDAERGGRAALLVGAVAQSPYQPRRLGLCLPVPNAERLAAWWGGELLMGAERPRPLREGVLEGWSGRLRWRDRMSGREGLERPAGDRAWRRWIEAANEAALPLRLAPPIPAALAMAAALAAKGEPTLLFVSTRALARRLGALLAGLDAAQAPPAELLDRARRLADREPCHDHALLLRTLEGGVGVHHADLSAAGRALVEEALATGALKLAVATATLAQGMNFQVANVIQWPYQAAAGDGAPGLREEPLERWRYAEQGGRAARLGRGKGPGRSVVVAATPPRAGELWEHYIEAGTEALEPRLTDNDLAVGVLLQLGGGAARTASNLTAALAATVPDQGEEPGFADRVARAIDEVRAERLATAEEGGTLRLTATGMLALRHGLSPRRVRRLRRWIGDPGLGGTDPVPRLLALAWCAPEGVWPTGKANGRTATDAVRQWLASQHLEAPAAMATALARPSGLSARECGAIEAAARVARWIGEEPTAQVEHATGWTAGMLARAGEAMAWLARAAAGLTQLDEGEESAAAEAWRTLAARLESGAPEAAASLAALRLAGIGRTALQALAADGLATPEALAAAPHDLLARRLGDAELARSAAAAARAALERGVIDLMAGAQTVATPSPRPHPVVAAEAVAAVAAPEVERAPTLSIDLQSPGIVTACGREVRLTPRLFDFLAALAEMPGRVLTRQALYHRLWPEEGPEEQQLDDTRRRLCRALAPVLGIPAPVEVVRGQGFRLRIDPAEVALRRG